MNSQIDIAVVGASGYTGCELLRLLRGHPGVRLAQVTSRRLAGERIDKYYPQFFPWQKRFDDFSIEALGQCELVFFATPSGVCMEHAAELLGRRVRIIDLSADFRIRDPGLWRRWYQKEHTAPEHLAAAVYGLTEFARDDIVRASLIANPGCYPTAVGLALVPLIEAGALSAQTIVADCKSGASGAGRTLREDLLYCELNESVHAYALSGHRHQAEIDFLVLTHAAGVKPRVQFVPHILPMHRGMLATLYLYSDLGHEGLRQILCARYDQESFVCVTEPGQSLRTAQVCHTNLCALAICPTPDPKMIVVISAIDNLLKGAAGQAVQNMNCLYGWPEDTGLGGNTLACG